ncbi:MAG: hypothetical protein M3Y73_03125 [Actinomycetota bacterium]|nr:hypothetical protein [Actinomycetota bacterium]
MASGSCEALAGIVDVEFHLDGASRQVFLRGRIRPGERTWKVWRQGPARRRASRRRAARRVGAADRA